ncbi:hypothetical protein F5Y08DRAFT_269818 [Xylaria arbuscula]|nr:hypothetical protein F5Y08DRAFT_269818 [Xylaria arbuscula]
MPRPPSQPRPEPQGGFNPLVQHPGYTTAPNYLGCDRCKKDGFLCDGHRPNCDTCRLRSQRCSYTGGQKRSYQEFHPNVPPGAGDPRSPPSQGGARAYIEQQIPRQQIPRQLPPWPPSSPVAPPLNWNGNGPVGGVQGGMMPPPPPPPPRAYAPNARHYNWTPNDPPTQPAYRPVWTTALEPVDTDPDWPSWVEKYCSESNSRHPAQFR